LHGGDVVLGCGAPLLLLAFWYRNTPERAAGCVLASTRSVFVALRLIGLGMHVTILVLMNVEPFTW